jgi:hypothetical protein
LGISDKPFGWFGKSSTDNSHLAAAALVNLRVSLLTLTWSGSKVGYETTILKRG